MDGAIKDDVGVASSLSSSASSPKKYPESPPDDSLALDSLPPLSGVLSTNSISCSTPKSILCKSRAPLGVPPRPRRVSSHSSPSSAINDRQSDANQSDTLLTFSSAVGRRATRRARGVVIPGGGDAIGIVFAVIIEGVVAAERPVSASVPRRATVSSTPANVVDDDAALCFRRRSATSRSSSKKISANASNAIAFVSLVRCASNHASTAIASRSAHSARDAVAKTTKFIASKNILTTTRHTT
jgi:hypothetical protein